MTLRSCPNCGKTFQGICLICGFDPKTGQAKLSPEQLGFEARGPFVDIWIGNFPDEESYEEYFDELEDDEFPSYFAADQGLEFCDHDFFVCWYETDLETACKEVFAPETDLGDILGAARVLQQRNPNFVAMQLDELSATGRQKSVDGLNYWIHYLGRFRYRK